MGLLHCEEIDLNSLGDLAKVDHITPCFVYSKNQLLQNINLYKKLESNINCDVGFSMKANHNPEILKIILDQGLNVVTVSGYEIALALKIGFSGKQIFYNGVGKQEWEIDLAIKNNCFINVDSIFDAELISNVLSKRKIVLLKVLIRLKPNFSARVH